MCVSSRSSLVLFLSGFIGSLALLYKTKDLNNLFLLFVIGIQLAEYFMWIDIESGGQYHNLNIIGNYISILFLFLQTSGLSILIPKKYRLFVVIPNLVYYLIITILYTKKLLTDKKAALTTVGKTNTLVWSVIPKSSTLKWIGLILYIMSNVYINVFHFNTYIASIFNLFLILISFKVVNSFRAEDYSSIYCYIGAIVTILYVVYEMYNDKLI